MPGRRGSAPRGRRGGRGQSAGRWRGASQNTSAIPTAFGTRNAALAFAGAGAHGHSMADEARNTVKRPRTLFGQDARLRHKPVTFVSAGLMNPLDELNFKPLTADSPPKPAQVPAQPTSNTNADLPVPPPPNEETRAPSPGLPFIIDTTGDSSLRPSAADPVPVPKHESDTESDASEDVILFKGRNHALRQVTDSETSARSSPKPPVATDSLQFHDMDVEIRVVETALVDKETTEAKKPASQHAVHPAARRKDSPITKRDSPKEQSALDALLDQTQSDEEAALIADYMANMTGDEDRNGPKLDAEAHPGLGSHAFHLLRDIGGTDSDAVPGHLTENDSSEGEAGDDKGEEAESSSAQRQRLEARDEEMARVLAKQEELGLGGDDVVLYDDAESEEGQEEWHSATKSTPRRKKKGSSKTAKIIQKKGHYPSATAMADAFDDLDLMDWHRAALDNFNQAAKRATKAPHVSDSELEEAMQMSFQNSRLKKAEKKRQREALRAQGLLGKAVDPEALRVKYPVGMSKEDISFEIEQFLIGDDEQLNFPPLDKHARKQIHLIANKLKLKSQSSGGGDNRYPTLYRTGRTLPYEESSFESLVGRALNRPWFTRVDVDTETAKAYRAKHRDTNPRRGRNALSYREGEVVGHHATELASDNKGRVLLEKMGWTKGTALGTQQNKGIMVPIAHVMKKSKIGLGDAQES